MSKFPSPSKRWTLAELNSEQTKSNHSWLIIKDRVYDAKTWMDKHPGGDLVIIHCLHQDATVQFTRFHPEYVEDKMLQRFCIGKIDEEEAKGLISHSSLNEDFCLLENELKAKGYFITSPNFYIQEIFKGLVLFLLTFGLILYGNQSLLCYLAASFTMAAAWQQLAFVGHDTGHNGVSGKNKLDHFFGILIANFIGGLSIGWWKDTHYVHHVITNDPEHDPDIQHLPFMAVTTRFFNNIFSSYHKRVMIFNGAAKVLVGIQHYLYYVIMMCGRFNLYIQGINFILTNKRCRNQKLEIVGLMVCCLWYGLLVSYIQSWQYKMLFVILSHAMSGLLHVQITISHFSMDTEITNENEEFFKHQLRTTMDVECPEWLDWLHGGLQFQVIHHLFPRMPRKNLRKAREDVLKLCKKHGVGYKSYDFISGNITVINHLKMISNKIN